VEKQKINYDNAILIISFYSEMSLLKWIVNLMTWHEILFLTIDVNTDALIYYLHALYVYVLCEDSIIIQLV
jgi:hypothetical protein